MCKHCVKHILVFEWKLTPVAYGSELLDPL
jgi:hypothetical protein